MAPGKNWIKGSVNQLNSHLKLFNNDFFPFIIEKLRSDMQLKAFPKKERQYCKVLMNEEIALFRISFWLSLIKIAEKKRAGKMKKKNL